jgi:DNA-directed RNA polymerase specialized sigma24 family protein
MPLDEQHPRIAAYFRAAAGRHGYSGSDRDALVCEMLDLLEQVEAEDKGLLHRIGDRPDHPSQFAGSDERRILRMVVDSVVGNGRVRRGRTRTEPLGDVDFASSDDDPSTIVERKERRDILGAALGRAIEDHLTEQQRALVVDVYWKGLTQADVARSQSRPRQRVHDDLNAVIGILADKIGHLRDLHVSS